jgi:hypothetical protein
MIKITLEAQDGKNITKRTGKSKITGTIKGLPQDGDYLLVSYNKEEETESPGVFIDINNVENIDNEYRFSDFNDRQFKITVHK